ncbi:hypothetical protein B0H15DRAFT_295065 [Mycena belliarum]|uniref:Uncharacterized protein n=1 Tax=Mycena belliarum TaxID=1033014 RepID=A0AAD6XUB4_9AGAR|nr:hypothetical protein B0H15DRAFT_295065 [Mycena belliae]
MHLPFFAGGLYLFISALVVEPAPGNKLVPLPQRRHLPSTSFQHRALARRRLLPRALKRELAPRSTINLAYGLESHSSPSTTVKFTAPPHRPIVLLEELDHLLESVLCRPNNEGGAELELNFISEDTHAGALASWSSLRTFSLVTFHSTCNLPDRRGAWLISAVQKAVGGNPQLRLTAQSVPLGEIAPSFRISHRADAVASYSPVIPRGIFDKQLDKVFTFGKAFNFAPRQRLFPVDSTLLARATPSPGISAGGLQVFCVDCGSRTNFSVGVEIDVDGLEIKAAHVNMTVLQFEHDINLEFSFNDSLSFHQAMDVIRAPVPDLAIEVPDVFSGGFFYGGRFSADLDISGALNFSIGARATIPSGASASLVMLGDANSSATGWDGASFGLIPFRLNSGSFNASAQLTLSPFLDFELSLFKGGLSGSARIAVNTPQVSAASLVHTNVNRACQPVGPTDFESFASALTFGAGARLDIHASVNGSLLPGASAALFAHNVTFGDVPTPGAPECFVIADDNPADSATMAGLVPAPTGTLRAAAVAVPTFNVAGIEAYFKASGALPTNVNYTQMLQATAVPDDIKAAVEKTASAGGGGGKGKGNGAARSEVWVGMLVLVGVSMGVAVTLL